MNRCTLSPQTEKGSPGQEAAHFLPRQPCLPLRELHLLLHVPHDPVSLLLERGEVDLRGRNESFRRVN